MAMQRCIIPVAYFLRIPNAGDRINADIVSRLTGHHTVHVQASNTPHLLAIGSLMSIATPSSIIWGTGVMHPDMGFGTPQEENIRALRGRLSSRVLCQAGFSVENVPLGDPAFLAPNLLEIERQKTPQYRVGLVCHYTDRYNRHLRHILSESDVADLNVHEQPETFLRRIAKCEVVVSTSLHGLVFAEALGIPNLWLKAGDEIAGEGFKFQDWFSTTRRPQAAPHVLEPNDTSETLAARATCHESDIDVEALSKAFPYDLLDTLEKSSRINLVNFDI